MAFDIALRDNGAGTFDLALSAAITASVNVSDANDAVSSTATATVPSFTATASIADAPDTIAGAATFTPLPITAAVTITDAADTVASVVDSGVGEASGGNGGGSGLVSYPQFFQRPAQRRLSHAELVACSQAAGFL